MFLARVLSVVRPRTSFDPVRAAALAFFLAGGCLVGAAVMRAPASPVVFVAFTVFLFAEFPLLTLLAFARPSRSKAGRCVFGFGAALILAAVGLALLSCRVPLPAYAAAAGATVVGAVLSLYVRTGETPRSAGA